MLSIGRIVIFLFIGTLLSLMRSQVVAQCPSVGPTIDSVHFKRPNVCSDGTNLGNGQVVVTMPYNVGASTYYGLLDGAGNYFGTTGDGSAIQVFNNVSIGNHTYAVSSNPGCPFSYVNFVVTAGDTLAPVTVTATSAPEKICSNGISTSSGQIQLHATGGGNGLGSFSYDYVWNNGFSGCGTANYCNLYGLHAGNYTVTVSNHAFPTCPAYIANITVGVTQLSAITVTATSTAEIVCPDGSGRHNGIACVAASGGGNGNGSFYYTYHWSNNATGNCINGISAGIYTVTVSNTTFTVCPTTVVSDTVLATTLAASVNATNACNGLNNGSANVITNGGGTNYTYSWNTSPVSHSAGISNQAPGTYVVTVTDNAGCSLSASAVIGNGSVVPSITISSNAIINCAGNPIGFTATVVNGGNTPGYQWKVNGITLATGNSFTSSNLHSGDTISCILTSNSACANPSQVVSNAVVVNIIEADTVHFYDTIFAGTSYYFNGYSIFNAGVYIDTSTAVSGCDSFTVLHLVAVPIDSSVSLSGAQLLISQPNASYQWFDCGTGQSIQGATDAFFEPQSSGSYQCLVTVGNQSYLTSCYAVVINGVSEVTVDEMVVFPNPAESWVLVSSKNEEVNEVAIINMFGEMLLRNDSGNPLMAIKQLSAATYIIEITIGSKKIRRLLVKL